MPHMPQTGKVAGPPWQPTPGTKSVTESDRSCKSLDSFNSFGSPIEFQGRRCDPNSVCYKNYSQAWGYRMRLLSSIFPKMALATACQFIPHNLDIGGFFPCYKMPFVFNNCTYKDIPFATKCQCRFQ